MRIELGLVLRHVTGVAEKVNAVNYLSKPPPPNDEYYYEQDSYAVNDQMGVFERTPKAPIRRIGAKVKETKVETMVIITARVIMYDMGLTTATTTSTGVTMVTQMIRVDPMFLLKIREVAPRDGGGSMVRVEDMFQKMMRRFDASDDHTKE